MKKNRKHLPVSEKLTALRRHLLGGEPVSAICVSWSGSRADVMESRLTLFDDLVTLNRQYTDAILAEKVRFERMVERERESEQEEHRTHYERFE